MTTRTARKSLAVSSPAASQNGTGPQAATPGYLVIHEDGSVDGVRITPDKTGLYAEILLGVASNLLAQFRAHLANPTSEGKDPI
jgi:hypothetical protein